MSNLTSQQLQNVLTNVKALAAAVTSQISASKNPSLSASVLYTPRRIYSRKGGKLFKNGQEEDEQSTQCKGRSICTLLKQLINGTTSNLVDLKTALGSNTVLASARELEVANPLEIITLAAALKIDVGKEDYSQWVAKIRANPTGYGFPATTKKYLKQSGGFDMPLDRLIKDEAIRLGAPPATVNALKNIERKNDMMDQDNRAFLRDLRNEIPDPANKTQFSATVKGWIDAKNQAAIAAVAPAVAAPAVAAPAPAPAAVAPAAVPQQQAAAAKAAAQLLMNATAASPAATAKLPAIVVNANPSAPAPTAAPAAASAAASKNSELDAFTNNSSLQYFIMTLFEFLRLNPALYSSASAPIQVMVPMIARGRVMFADHLFSGGSITDTILNTPSYSIQSGGSKSDLDRVEQTLKSDIKLYSNQLRFEVDRLKQSMAAANKQMDASDLAQLDTAITRVAASEQAVLTTALLGHKFLEAHHMYKDANTDDANVSLQKLVEIAALLATQKDKLTRRNQQVARSLSGALTLFTPQVLFTRQ